MQGLQEIFSLIYAHKLWGDGETLSGCNSTLEATGPLMARLPQLLAELQAESLLDLPCGDFNWMSQLDLSRIRYHGADIVPEVVKRNQELYASDNRTFSRLDLTHDDLPAADLILIRDCLLHLSNLQIMRCLKNLRRHSFAHLLISTAPECEVNQNIESGLWRMVNLCQPPFSLPAPLQLIPDHASGWSLGLWSGAQLKAGH